MHHDKFMRVVKYIYLSVCLLCMSTLALAQTPHWTYNPNEFEYDMTVFLTIVDTNSMNLSKYEVAAFVAGECRGVSSLETNENGSQYLYLRIRSHNVEGETISFKCYDYVKEKEYDISNTLIFENRTFIGYPGTPFPMLLMLDPDYHTICYGDSLVWHNQIYIETGVYVDTLINGVATLHLTILPEVPITNESATICQGDAFTWQADGRVYSETGEYRVALQNTHGCDSIITLHLTVNPTVYTEEIITACDSYDWNGETYTKSGNYTYNTTTDQGCERVDVLHLTILPNAIIESEELALCPSELPLEWYGQTLTEAGVYTATEKYAGTECDSVIHELTLNVYERSFLVTIESSDEAQGSVNIEINP